MKLIPNKRMLFFKRKLANLLLALAIVLAPMQHVLAMNTMLGDQLKNGGGAVAHQAMMKHSADQQTGKTTGDTGCSECEMCSHCAGVVFYFQKHHTVVENDHPEWINKASHYFYPHPELRPPRYS